MAAAETWGAGEVSQAQILQGMTGFNLERGRRGAGDRPGRACVFGKIRTAALWRTLILRQKTESQRGKGLVRIGQGVRG